MSFICISRTLNILRKNVRHQTAVSIINQDYQHAIKTKKCYQNGHLFSIFNEYFFCYQVVLLLFHVCQQSYKFYMNKKFQVYTEL